MGALGFATHGSSAGKLPTEAHGRRRCRAHMQREKSKYLQLHEWGVCITGCHKWPDRSCWEIHCVRQSLPRCLGTPAYMILANARKGKFV